MHHSSLNLLLGLGLSTLSSAAPLSVPRTDTAPYISTLLIGGGPSGTIAAAQFDGSSFKIVANNTIPGTSPSWLLLQDGTNHLYAVDENSNRTRLFDFNKAANTINLVQDAFGSAGNVFLEFTADRTQMLAASFGEGKVDVFDLAPETGLLSLNGQLVSSDTLGPNAVRQEAPHPHQVLLDTSGQFFVVPDLGTDTLLVIDSNSTNFDITNRVRVQPPGCGPRHGVFWPPLEAGDGQPFQASHYFLVCELLNLAIVFELDYSGNTIQFSQTQTLSTFGEAFPPANATTAAAGEIQVSADGRDVYISNRVTGNATDSIAHFGVEIDADTLDVSLDFKDTISSGGLVPRMFDLEVPTEDGKQQFVFVTNQAGALGLVAFRRNVEDGSLDPTPVASLPVSAFGADGFGPQFVLPDV
ncbi:Lactonase, 7-bladed beta-propeller-domain-containing protein [Coniochaeta sp. 2T2.1]|nr:Lactonase, 7-bladed beta-propeller-domain-containing protein [Coniochaeta sp. 2T2.1]